MPRTARASQAGFCYHVLNRGNGRREVFHGDADYRAFVTATADATLCVPMRMVAYCLMPNHFHLVLWPLGDGDLGRWMHRLANAHVRRYRRRYRGSGHVWQGRFKAFPIQEDEHLLTVMRYVERNPVRAGLASRAQDWLWSSAGWVGGVVLDPGPCPRLADWLDWVNRPITEAEVERLCICTARGRPDGADGWVGSTTVQLNGENRKPENRDILGSTWQSVGRPLTLVTMPRTARASQAGFCYHVLNRGNGRREVLHDDADDRAFVTATADATLYVPMRTVAYCLMPNHFHLVLWPLRRRRPRKGKRTGTFPTAPMAA